MQASPGASAPLLPAIQTALLAAGLPFADLSEAHLADFLVTLDAAGTVARCGGIEVFGRDALLRSLFVAEGEQGKGLGASLLTELERYAHQRGVRQLYLLTTTAAPFFARHGYSQADRDGVPPALQATTEFSTLCPASATCMSKQLRGKA